MIIKESVKMNIALKSHPEGLKKILKMDMEKAANLSKIQGPKNVLIIGGSSGYGLATREVVSQAMNANSYSVHFEGEPTEKRTGTAGFWNVKYFKEFSKTETYDFNGDAFSEEMKEKVTNLIKENNHKIDLVVYSLAAGARPKGDELIKSTLKPVGKTIEGKSIDIGKEKIIPLVLEGASQEEIHNTIYVMGGSDWYNWISLLSEKDLLSKDAITLSYTYIGGECTKDIYREGTIGKAKVDLENTAKKIGEDFKINSQIVSAKAITTKASVFIPSMPIYAGFLFDVMKKHNLHETPLEHIHRLFDKMIYGSEKEVDGEGRIRLDNWELREEIQQETLNLMKNSKDEDIFNVPGIRNFIDEFYNINGFRVPGIDYSKDLDLSELNK